MPLFMEFQLISKFPKHAGRVRRLPTSFACFEAMPGLDARVYDEEHCQAVYGDRFYQDDEE